MIELAEKDPLVRKALSPYGGLKHNWKNLYMVLEVVEDDAGGEDGLIGKGRVRREKIKLFKRTANSFLIPGYQARHATETTKPPQEPMSLDYAKSLINDVLENWLCSK